MHVTRIVRISDQTPIPTTERSLTNNACTIRNLSIEIAVNIPNSTLNKVCSIDRSIKNEQKQDFKMPGKEKDVFPFEKLEGW